MPKFSSLTPVKIRMSFAKESLKEIFYQFKYGLYTALFLRSAIPTVYQTFRVSILGSLQDTSQINVASQMTWVSVLLKTIEESVLLPLYFCFGNSIDDVTATKNKIKTGFIVTALVYSILSASTSGLAWLLIKG